MWLSRLSKIMRWLLLLLLPIAANAEWSPPSNRSIEWSNYCGVPGGIPNRTTIYTNLLPGVTATDIRNAITACPSNQVVYLTAGLYNVGSISFLTRSGRTLRGAGMGATIINSSGNPAIETDQYDFTGTPQAISGTYAKGATTVTLTTTPNAQFSVGNLMLIRQADDTNFVYTTSGGQGTNMEFAVFITAVSGNDITFAEPLPWGLTNSPSALYLNGGPGLRWSGIENMTITNNSGSSETVYFVGAYACWVKGVEVVKFVNSGVQFVNSVQCEMRSCYVHDALSFPNNPDGFGVYAYNNSTFLRIEDNIFRRCAVGMLQSSSSGNAWLFNYTREVTFNGWTYQTGGINANHGAHPMMCLWEGNITEQWQSDGYHGSASHQMLFRDWLHGVSEMGATGNRKTVSMERGSYHNSVVGCVLGDASWTNATGFALEMSGEPDYDSAAVIYRLGYPDVADNELGTPNAPAWPAPFHGNYPDTNVSFTLQRVANWDWKSRAIVNDTNLPNSLFYAEKPAYFGFLGWPAFDKGAPSSATATNTPAAWRYNAPGQSYPYTNDVPAAAAATGEPTRKQGLRGIRLRLQ